MRLKFSTHEDPVKSKTKCVAFSKVKNLKYKLAQIILNGDPLLPWVDRVKNSGNLLESDNSMKDKRGKIIGKVNSMLQEFSLLTVHSWSGSWQSMLYLFMAAFPELILPKIFSSWNVRGFELAWRTHRYFIKAVLGTSPPKRLLCSRFDKFLGSLKNYQKGSVRYLASLVCNVRRTTLSPR